MSKGQLSTIWEEDEFATTRAASPSRTNKGKVALQSSLTENELQGSEIQGHATLTAKELKSCAKFTTVLRAAPAESSSSDSPLKETSWEDAGLIPVPSLPSPSSQCRNRNTRSQGSPKEQECIDFWLRFFD